MTLEERIASLEHEQTRLQAVVEIQNLISTYAYYHAANMNDECVPLFALRTPGVAVDIPHIGVYDSGADGIRRCYSVAHNAGIECEEDKAGMLMLRPMTTPVIQVAEDGMTAQGLWLSPGLSTGGDPEHGYTASWAWIKYGCDFVKEDGVWKFWHLRVFGIFMTPFHESWVESSQKVPTPEEIEMRRKMMEERAAHQPAEAKPDRTNEDYDWTYAVDRVYPGDFPPPPTPYKTWDDSRTMMHTEK